MARTSVTRRAHPSRGLGRAPDRDRRRAGRFAPRDPRDTYRLGARLKIDAEAMLRLFGEPEANKRAFTALARFLDVRCLDTTESAESQPRARSSSPSRSSSSCSGLSGYLPHVTACVECSARDTTSSASRPRAGWRRLPATCGRARSRFPRRASRGSSGSSLDSRSSDAAAAGLGAAAPAAKRLKVVTCSYEEHGGFRLRSLSA